LALRTTGLPAAARHDPADHSSREKTDDDYDDERRSPDADDPMHVHLVEVEYGEEDGESSEANAAMSRARSVRER
jgi:hypothetical protein